MLGIGKSLSGFTVIEEKDLAEYNSTAYRLTHDKSGANLLYIKNDDSNKVFSVTFKTFSKNSKGTAHIIEHAVLCGSRKYRVKEPFIELEKGSLHTYLNAMTFSDKTMYPVASLNQADFMNLMDVYLDAVFFPLLEERKEIFLQEGWRKELFDKDGEVYYNGVVYNEMMGSFSSAEAKFQKQIMEAMFDNEYKYQAAGYPSDIVNLTYDEYINFYKTYYHPSNSLIYIYGDADIEKCLSLIDKDYLSEFEKAELNADYNYQKTAPEEFVYTKYNASDDKSDNKNYLSANYIVDTASNYELIFSLDIISYMLLSDNSSLLKNAILESGIAKSVEYSLNNAIRQPVFSILVTNTEQGKLKQLKEVITKILQKTIENGIDKQLIQSAINRYEFSIKEQRYGYRPKGLVYGINAATAFVHGFDMADSINKFRQIENIKSYLSNNPRYFEEIIEKHLINNKLQCYIEMSPTISQPENPHTDKLKKIIDEKKISEIIDESNKLKLFLQKENTAEQLLQIPIIKITDISRTPNKTETEIINIYNRQIAQNIENTNEIFYIKLMFDLKKLPKSLLNYAGLLSILLGQTGTKKYDNKQLSKQIDLYTGGISFYCESFLDIQGKSVSNFVIKAKSLNKNINNLFEIIENIINESEYEIRTISRLLKEIKIQKDRTIINNLNQYSINRCLSYVSESAKYNEIFRGIDFYTFLTELCTNDLDNANNFETIKQNLTKTCKLIFTQENITASVTADSDSIFAEVLNNFIKSLHPSVTADEQEELGVTKTFNEGFIVSSNIYSNVTTASFSPDFSYTGALNVLRTILDTEFLWNSVRIQGGAYDCSSYFGKDNLFYIQSMRDPNVAETYEKYSQLPTIIKNFNCTDRELTKYIIGSMNRQDRPLSNSEKNDKQALMFTTGLTYESLCKERQETLDTTMSRINQLSDLLEHCLKKSHRCTVGCEQKINSKTFDHIISL